jgi:hypothetical protein
VLTSLYESTGTELSNGLWHMVVRGCVQILCSGRKAAKSLLKGTKIENKNPGHKTTDFRIYQFKIQIFGFNAVT